MYSDTNYYYKGFNVAMIKYTLVFEETLDTNPQ